MNSGNYSILSILAAYGLVLAPHTYAVIMVNNAGSGIKYNNANPRNQSEVLEKKLTKNQFETFQRLRAATANGFEGLPLYGLAVVSINYFLSLFLTTNQ